MKDPISKVSHAWNGWWRSTQWKTGKKMLWWYHGSVSLYIT